MHMCVHLLRIFTLHIVCDLMKSCCSQYEYLYKNFIALLFSLIESTFTCILCPAVSCTVHIHVF